MAGVKTFIARDSKGNCPNGASKELLNGVPACGIFCPGGKIGGTTPNTYFGCNGGGSYIFSPENGNTLYDGSAGYMGSMGFVYDGAQTCNSIIGESSGKIPSFTLDDKTAACCKQSAPGGCQIDLSKYWADRSGKQFPAPTPAFNWNCENGSCVTDYSGPFKTIQDCQSYCKSSPPSPPSKNKNMVIIFSVVGGAILLFLIIIGLYFFMKKKKGKSAFW